MVSNQDAPTTWLQLRFICDDVTAAKLAEHLADVGSLAVSLDDAEDQPLYEPPPGATPLWANTRVTGLFPGTRSSASLLDALQRRFAPVRLPDPEVCVLEDQEWVRLYQDAFEPTCFGGRLWVVPTWAQAPAFEAGQVGMVLDPGIAFGTGSHPTTAMCLAWLAGEDILDGRAVDYGCGSGILSVAAAKLGARRVWAVDNDPQALDATRRNAEDNGVGEQIQVHLPADVPPLTADLLISNILANTLSGLAQTLSTLLAPGGRLALAGILAEQSPAVIASFAPWCALHPIDQREDWVLLAGTRAEQGA
ncbi:MAG: 50S ribosomal protein L11 methyltransferase [Gammaproteobacteria bacterium]|nr:50S ribosomal protein L11 methyltransferase [Gammaproteobacteria bacterium]MDX2460409.1 50S ribosomal protein L11 methyltransferase [Gammaproteobacteria bacterium]